MDVSKAEAVTPVGQGGPRKDQKRGSKEKQEDGTNGEAAGDDSPWAGTEAFAVDGVLAGDLSPQIQQAFDGLARQIEPLRAEVERARGREVHFKELAEKIRPLHKKLSRRQFLTNTKDFKEANEKLVAVTANLDSEMKSLEGKAQLLKNIGKIVEGVDRVAKTLM